MKITIGDPGPVYMVKDGGVEKTWMAFARLWVTWRGFMFWARTKGGKRVYRAMAWRPNPSTRSAFLAVLAFSILAAGWTWDSASGADKATLSVTPSAIAVGDSLSFSGCGYTPAEGVSVVLRSPYAISFFGATADSNGCFDTTTTETYIALEAGEYTARAYQSNDHHADAELSFTVST